MCLAWMSRKSRWRKIQPAGKKDFKPFLKSPTVGNSDLVTRWEALQTRQFLSGNYLSD